MSILKGIHFIVAMNLKIYSKIVDSIFSNLLDPVSFTLEQSVYEVVEGETARVCLLANSHDLPLIRFHLNIWDIRGNATGRVQHNYEYSEQKSGIFFQHQKFLEYYTPSIKHWNNIILTYIVYSEHFIPKMLLCFTNPEFYLIHLYGIYTVLF